MITENNTKRCSKCLKELDLTLFSKDHNRKDGLTPQCKICQKEYREANRDKRNAQKREYAKNNKEKIAASNKRYNSENKERINKRNREYAKANIDRKHEMDRLYYIANKEKLNAYHKEYRQTESGSQKIKQWNENNRERNNELRRSRYKNDPFYKARSIVSGCISKWIKNGGGIKNGRSFTKYLNYTLEELLTYLESKFEWWMTWGNWGLYNKNTWDDNDSSTWTWQIDHIMPQSLLPYDSMEHPNFKKCWALENLRPYSAKQNLFDGARK